MGHGWPDFWRTEVVRVLLEQERVDDAEEMLARVQRVDAGEEASVCLQRARVLARRGDAGEAERLARTAVDLFERTDSPTFQAAAYRALAEVLRLAGKREDAAAAFRRSLALDEERGATLTAGRTRTMLAELGRA